MKFSENRLYVEGYVKCCNCGVLIYETSRPQAVEQEGRTYCSAWCVDWALARSAAKAGGNPAQAELSKT